MNKNYLNCLELRTFFLETMFYSILMYLMYNFNSEM